MALFFLLTLLFLFSNSLLSNVALHFGGTAGRIVGGDAVYANRNFEVDQKYKCCSIIHSLLYPENGLLI